MLKNHTKSSLYEIVYESLFCQGPEVDGKWFSKVSAMLFLLSVLLLILYY